MEQLELFQELTLNAGDFINGKGERIYSKDIYKDMLFVQQHSNVFIICRVVTITPSQITYSMGGYDLNYTRPEYIDYEGEGFESCLWWRVPEDFKVINNALF